MVRPLQLLDVFLSSHKSVKASVGLTLLLFTLWWLYAPSQKPELVSSRIEETPTNQSDPSVSKGSNSAGANTSYRPQTSPIQPAEVRQSEPKAATPNLADELRNIELESLKERIVLLVANLKKLEDRHAEWINRKGELAANDSGRRMVSNEKVIPIVLSLLKGEIVSESDLFVLRKQVGLLERQRLALSRSTSMGEVNKAVEQADRRVIELNDDIDKAWLSLSSLESQCQTFPPAAMTLGEAINKKSKDEALAWAESKRKLNEEADRKTREMEAKAETVRLQLEMDKKKAVADAEAKRLADETIALRKAAEQKAERARLEAEFNREHAQIMHYLSPLFAEGYSQPKSVDNSKQGTVKRPMSLAAIKSYGALNAPDGSEGGFVKLLWLFNDKSNDRKVRGPYPHYFGGALNPGEIEAIRPAYMLLQKYQTLLVEKGYLQP